MHNISITNWKKNKCIDRLVCQGTGNNILGGGVGHLSGGFSAGSGTNLVRSSVLRAENTSQSCSDNVNTLFGLPMSPTTWGCNTVITQVTVNSPTTVCCHIHRATKKAINSEIYILVQWQKAKICCAWSNTMHIQINSKQKISNTLFCPK